MVNFVIIRVLAFCNFFSELKRIQFDLTLNGARNNFYIWTKHCFQFRCREKILRKAEIVFDRNERKKCVFPAIFELPKRQIIIFFLL